MLTLGYGLEFFFIMYKIQISDGVNSVVFVELPSIEPAVKLALDLRGVVTSLAKSNQSKCVDVSVLQGDSVVLSFVRPAPER